MEDDVSIQDDIWGMDLTLAAKTLRETREALEAGGQFKTDTAVRSLDKALTEAERIRALLAQRRAA